MMTSVRLDLVEIVDMKIEKTLELGVDEDPLQLNNNAGLEDDFALDDDFALEDDLALEDDFAVEDDLALEDNLAVEDNLELDIDVEALEPLEPGKIRCHACSKVLAKSSLNNHIKGVHKGLIKRNFPCLQCPYKASSSQNLRFHVDYKHKSTREFECKATGCLFSACTELRLAQHNLVCLGKRLRCEERESKKATKRKWSVDKKADELEKVKNYEAKQKADEVKRKADEAKRRKDEAKKREDEAKKKEDELFSFHCQVGPCIARFTSAGALERHVENVH